MTVTYFAYGSNMHPRRLAERIGPAPLVAPAIAAGYRLAFHKHGRDGSGKCDMLRTDRGEDCVHGVVFRIEERQKASLDAIEGVGRGYVETELSVRTATGAIRVQSYAAQHGHIDPSLAPFDWYKALVLEAARHHGFPEAYVRAIERVNAIADPDSRRAHSHWCLLEAPTGRAGGAR